MKEELEKLKDIYTERVRNTLKSDSRVVFGEGNIKAKIVLIGEAPGEKEEQTGRPFVGAAGKNLDEFLKIIELKREDIYITNVVKIRPFKVNPKTERKSNRPPNKAEIELSVDILEKQIEIIDPEVVVTLGNVPLKAMLKDDNAKIGDLHGEPVNFNKRIIFPLYHPASIIYNRSLADTYVNDVHKLKEYLDKHKIGGDKGEV